MINRELYLEQLRSFIDRPLIKVLTGIRRSGKSSLLIMLKEELKNRGVSDENIIFINFESMEYSDIDNAKSLYSFIKSSVSSNHKCYLLLDEIQEVKDWEKAINSFLVDCNVDIYITGSNSRLLSSELATYIAGRYIEIKVSPLSFKEVLEFKRTLTGTEPPDIQKELVQFIRMGGFPIIHTAGYTHDDVYKIINDIYASAILRDIVQRNRIRNIELLEKIVKYVFENLGSIFSAKKVADYFKNQMRKVDIETVYNYLNALEGAFIIYRVPRYDLRGKEVLQTNEKYFIGDQGLKYAMMGYRDRDISGILENIVFLELKRKGYQVYVGKFDDKEIDFVAVKREQKVYVQVAYKLAEESTVEREFGALLGVRDHYPKYVVTMEDFWQDNIEGVKHKNLAEFLLMDEY
ncbi:ATPase [Desulfosporosinus sp. HMP52]|uniref:ATP-binding protein n=1 Tax=Desulfosporosinus sp. HMP52 TaxID=1487923 RepID=UPI00051F88D3|nr:ATP-binding protein [Desulfosporosinus sp. HMP52]KGK91571.1 ATPase [Desulfosporosinus sp. HMP52]